LCFGLQQFVSLRRHPFSFGGGGAIVADQRAAPVGASRQEEGYGMKRRNWTAALAGGAVAVLIAEGGARAQIAQPAAPDAPVAQAPIVGEPPTAEAPAATETPAAAAPTVKKPKPKRKAAANTVAVTVMNSRAAGLVELQAATAGSGKMKTIAGALKPGKKVAARLPRGKDCLVNLHATFDDGQSTDATAVDACKNRTLNLTD
jgi:hypothetical protein